MGKMLEELALKRDDLLLAEIAALLHDIGKFHGDFVSNKVNSSGQIPYDYKIIGDVHQLQPDAVAALNTTANSDVRKLLKKLLTSQKQTTYQTFSSSQQKALESEITLLGEEYQIGELLLIRIHPDLRKATGFFQNSNGNVRTTLKLPALLHHAHEIAH